MRCARPTPAARIGSCSSYNPDLHLLYIPSIEGCDYIETVPQNDFADQGGTVNPRERFSGGSTRIQQRLYGALKAVDPTTGEIKVSLKLAYPNYSGALATAGNLVFIGEPGMARLSGPRCQDAAGDCGV